MAVFAKSIVLFLIMTHASIQGINVSDLQNVEKNWWVFSATSTNIYEVSQLSPSLSYHIHDY